MRKSMPAPFWTGLMALFTKHSPQGRSTDAEPLRCSAVISFFLVQDVRQDILVDLIKCFGAVHGQAFGLCERIVFVL